MFLHTHTNFIGLVFVINGGVYAFTAPFWGILVDRYVNPKLVAFFGSVFIAIGFCLVGPASFLPIET